jgi:hypothetical protein
MREEVARERRGDGNPTTSRGLSGAGLEAWATAVEGLASESLALAGRWDSIADRLAAAEADGWMTQTSRVTVNSEERLVIGPVVSYAEIVALALDTIPEAWRRATVLTVVYHKGHPDKPDGSLAPNTVVRVRSGMRFTVADTSSA